MALDPASRPSRLPRAIEVLAIVLLAVSFISGVFFWIGQEQLEEQLQAPRWLGWCRILHGSLNAPICVLFGYLLCQHIRYGWQLKANRPSGFVVELLLIVLILSAIGLYYAGGEKFREVLGWIHGIAGGMLPIAFLIHWIAARRWVRRIELRE